MTSYPDYLSKNFSDILNKKEFTDTNRDYLYQDSNQMLMRNYISKATTYENVLLYHNVGTGKTCNSISIAEGFKEYVHNMGRKIVVLVKNKNIQRNFINELLSRCTGDEYLTDNQRQMYFSTSKSSAQKQELVNKVHRFINKYYSFFTYGTFVNRVLGAKDFEKDDIGRNTNKVKRVDGEIQRKKPKNQLSSLSNSVIIVDEAHNITNNDIYIALHKVLSRSYNVRLVLLTATPLYDNPREIFELSNLLNVHDHNLQLPIRNDLIKPTQDNQMYLSRQTSELINNQVLKGGILSITEEGKQALERSLAGKVSYIKANTLTNPKVIEKGDDLIPYRKGTIKVVYCEMSKYQYVAYLHALKQDLKLDSKIDLSMAIQQLESSENLEETSGVSKSSSLYKNSSDASTMVYPGMTAGKEGFLKVFRKASYGFEVNDSDLKQVLTTKLKKYSAKLYTLLQNINSSPGNTFVYSNYVSYGGTTLVKQLLLQNGYFEYRSRTAGTHPFKNFVVFDESINAETRERYRRIFNSPENKNGELIKILIGSPVISEGVTLKNVRQVHILEPSWNMSRINQIVGRAVRNFSHHDLPESERNVEIYKYVSVYPTQNVTNKLLDFFIDREKYVLSEEKDRSNKQVERLLKEVSFDCQLTKTRNFIDSNFDGSPECDYQSCNYVCKNSDTHQNGALDTSTYNLNIEFFEKFDIQFIINTLRDLFTKNFVWNLTDIVDYIRSIEKNISIEAIYTTLGYIVETKSVFQDTYNRDGFIINKSDYYIFNPLDVDVNSSLFSKVLDFSVNTNKYSLDQYVQTRHGSSLYAPKPKQKVMKEEVQLTNSDKKYNDKIVQNQVVFGTYRQRGTKDNPYGPYDGKFRIVDSRESSSGDVDDKRKLISGMWIGSYKKGELIQVAKYLQIKTKYNFDEYDKEQLGKLIEKYLVENKLVLK
jgi:superfamily II DNA or RNA helicase